MGTAEYEEIAISNARMLTDKILVKWEQATEEYGKSGLVRPEQFRQAHYTGIVLSLGPKVSGDLVAIYEQDQKAGRETRIVFDQWSRFDKVWDPNHGRVAILAEIAQADCLAVIPARGEITLAGVHPVGHRVLIRPDVKEWETKGEIVVPGAKKLEVQQGEIVATGDAPSLEIRPGDVVLYQKYAGVEFTVEGQEYILLDAREEENGKILGVLEPAIYKEEVHA